MSHTNISLEQAEIISWFDNTYKTRGEWYLRPVKAYYIFLELLEAKGEHQLLDVACGLGRLLEAAKEYGCGLTGIDISSVAVEKAKAKLPTATIQVANAEELPFKDESFDLITCLGSLERMINLDKVLYELHRVGASGAKYCFLVRNSETATWNLKKLLGIDNKKGHQGAKTLGAWRAIFEDNSFKVRTILPDQYPLHKRKKWSSLGIGKVDYKQVVEDSKPLSFANEFLFILEKA